MAYEAPFVSVLVRAFNDEALIGRTLEGIFAQKAGFAFEVVVCDDASTDRTREIAARFPVRFFERPPGPYMPGRTLNAFVRDARGEIVVFNNSDAVPLDDRWLAELVKPLTDGGRRPSSVSSFANQLPRPDAQALVRKDSERAFGDGRIQATWRFFFSLASSATWRQNLVETPFDESIRYSEDVEWAWRNSRRAKDPVKIVYCPDSRVEHSHNYTLHELAKRFRGEGAADRVIFGDEPSLMRELAGAARETVRDWVYLAKRPRDWREIPCAPVRRLVQRVAHWRGMKSSLPPSSPSRFQTLENRSDLFSNEILVYLEKSGVRGGIEVFAERHVARLRAEGHEVVVASSLFAVSSIPLSCFDEIIIHKCSDVGTLEKFPPEKTVCYIHDHEPICPRGYAYTPFKRNCSRPGGLFPCLFCAPLCRGWKAAIGRVFSQKRRIAAMSKFKKIVVISQFMKSRLVANGIPAEKIAVEPPEIDVGESRCSSDSRASSIDLLYVGQLIRGKGVQLLLQAMARMKTPRTLDVVGTGNMEQKLKSLASKLGIADRVRFNGFQKNPQDWMRAAKCVVVPSFWQEPYGLVAAEAVALGRPVVAFAIGGLPEACGGRATLVPPGDIDALARELERK